MKRPAAVSAFVLGVAVGLGYYFHEYVPEWNATATQDLVLWSSESDAAHAESRGVPLPESHVKMGARVSVIRDRYGKDYWACYVRTRTNEAGWVLCTDLRSP